ncbi:MAG: hypothetical protein V3W31_10065 [Thermodesulfobacteriota bacterium]
MADIARAMERKGYTPLSADSYGGIGFRKSLKKGDRRLKEPVWFDTGMRMTDGKTPRTVKAVDEDQAEEFKSKGWKPVKKAVSRSRGRGGKK